LKNFTNDFSGQYAAIGALCVSEKYITFDLNIWRAFGSKDSKVSVV